MGQIIAIGGGRFTAASSSIEQYVLEQSPKAKPTVAFLATASGDQSVILKWGHDFLGQLNCTFNVVPLFNRTPDLRDAILKSDVVYVFGGNTKSMLAVWRDWGVDELLREAYEESIVLAGVSAGAICWFEQGLTDSWQGSLRMIDCLGFLPGSCCPHFDGEAERRPAYTDMIRSGEAKAGVAIDDDAACHFVNGELKEVVAVADTAKAYQVSSVREGQVEELPTRVLPA